MLRNLYWLNGGENIKLRLIVLQTVVECISCSCALVPLCPRALVP